MSQLTTNWYVITGGPSAGKTKTLEHLSYRGYKVIAEAARILIDNELSRGKTLEQIRSDERQFQEKILDMKIMTEERLNPEERLFLDRGIPDSIAYYRLNGADPDPIIELASNRIYKAVFLLEQLPFQKDGARIENADSAQRINDLLYQAYSELGSRIITVPVMSIADRADFILARIEHS